MKYVKLRNQPVNLGNREKKLVRVTTETLVKEIADIKVIFTISEKGGILQPTQHIFRLDGRPLHGQGILEEVYGEDKEYLRTNTRRYINLTEMFETLDEQDRGAVLLYYPQNKHVPVFVAIKQRKGSWDYNPDYLY